MGISDDDSFMLFAPCAELADRKVTSHIMFGSTKPVLNLDGPDKQLELQAPEEAEKAGLVADDMILLSLASTLLFSLLFVMDARKELLEPGQRTGKKRNEGSSSGHRTYWVKTTFFADPR